VAEAVLVSPRPTDSTGLRHRATLRRSGRGRATRTRLVRNTSERFSAPGSTRHAVRVAPLERSEPGSRRLTLGPSTDGPTAATRRITCDVVVAPLGSVDETALGSAETSSAARTATACNTSGSEAMAERRGAARAAVAAVRTRAPMLPTTSGVTGVRGTTVVGPAAVIMRRLTFAGCSRPVAASTTSSPVPSRCCRVDRAA
jgi:hypothetical protein